MADAMQVRRDTAANWTSNNPSGSTVLLDGQIGFETDTGNTKFGDGSTAWNDLLYATLRQDVLLDSQDFASGGPYTSYDFDNLAAWPRIRVELDGIVSSGVTRWRWRNASANISTASYYKRHWVSGGDGYSSLDGAYCLATSASDGQFRGIFYNHEKSDTPSRCQNAYGSSSTVSQVEEIIANADVTHAGIGIYTDTGSISAGRVKFWAAA